MLPIERVVVPKSPNDISTHKSVNIGMSDEEKLINNVNQSPVEESIITQDPNEKNPTP
jgi:hypothetical protein